MNITWQAENYKDNFSFVHQYGEDVLNLITGDTKQFVVDLGCGNGVLTQKLSERGFRVLGIDDSSEMLAIARQQYPDLEFLQGNAVNFQLKEKADVIFSNAVFHWIDGNRQEEMLRNLSCQLKTGGQLVCEFGGKGCAEQVHAALEELFRERGLSYLRFFYFPGIGEYTSLMEKCGFKVTYATLFDRPTPQKNENGLEEWIRMFNKKPFENLSEDTVNEILAQAKQSLQPVLFHDGKWFIDYVRIRIRAVKEPR